MAAIDKTYVDNYDDWKKIVDYMKDKCFTCPNGMKIYTYPCIYYPDMTKEEVENWLKEQSEIPVINTSNEIDYFLIKECPIDIVQERMKEVYDVEWYNSIKNGTSMYDTFVRPTGGKHLQLIEKPKLKRSFKFFGLYSNRVVHYGYKVQVEVPNGYAWYSEKYDYWLMPYELGSGSTNTAHTKCKTLKSLYRKILKWNLPVGTRVNFFNRFIEEEGTFKVTK